MAICCFFSKHFAGILTNVMVKVFWNLMGIFLARVLFNYEFHGFLKPIFFRRFRHLMAVLFLCDSFLCFFCLFNNQTSLFNIFSNPIHTFTFRWCRFITILGRRRSQIWMPAHFVVHRIVIIVLSSHRLIFVVVKSILLWLLVDLLW